MGNTMEELIGKVVVSAWHDLNNVIIDFADGTKARFYHMQYCCESVTVEDVNGDWNDLVGHPLLVAEERTKWGENDFGHETWTFYTFRSVGGSVDVRWYGESNGYYSEDVDLEITKASA
jgi:hypothetical protein